jgi:molybdopterin molybdotransferase
MEFRRPRERRPHGLAPAGILMFNTDMSPQYDIGFEEAVSRTLEHLTPLAPVSLAVDEAVGLVAAESCVAKVDCPSASVSSKDGYAVVRSDLEKLEANGRVRLKICGTSMAGGSSRMSVTAGTAVKIMTGAQIPDGADAVIAQEFATEEDGWTSCSHDSRRNIIERGYDVAKGQVLASPGEVLTPAKTGLLAAGGISTVRVHRRPRVGILATGDELVPSGEPLEAGQLYASNLVTLISWLRHFGMKAEVAIVGDEADSLAGAAERMLERVDVLLTSGGAWKSDRDLTVRVLQEMGGRLIFHRVQMGPGKAVALILLKDKTVFCLPGGPPSNEMAFLQIALPGLLHLAGRDAVPFECQQARLTKSLTGQKDWTQFFYAVTKEEGRQRSVSPVEAKSRIASAAIANALIKIPEGIERLEHQARVQVQVLFGDTGSRRSNE